MNNDNINKKSDSFNFTDVVKKINSDAEGTPWYKKKVSIISMSSVLGVGALATVIAVPIALTSGNTSSTVANTDWTVSSIKSIYDLNAHYAKLIISGEKLPPSASSYKVMSSTIKNTGGPITSNITVDVVVGDESVPNSVKVVQLGFNDSTLVEATKYQVEINGVSTPINTEQHILQPVINIGTQPTNHTIPTSTTSKKVTLTVEATVDNPIEGVALEYQWQQASANDNNWTNNIGAKSKSYEVDATSFPEATKKYYRCLVSYKYTEVKPSSSVYVEKAAGTVTPPITEGEAIAAFNKKTKDEKLTAYNTIMANVANNTKIKDYFFTNFGMNKFFEENIMPITTGDSLKIYSEFKAFLPTYTSTTIIYNPIDKTNFLQMKAIGRTDPVSGITTNLDSRNASTNVYCSQHNNLSASIAKYEFYSPIVSTIQNVVINSDFSITMNLSTDDKIENGAFKFYDTGYINHSFNYKKTIKFSNTTLFPGMSEFVKKSILGLAV